MIVATHLTLLPIAPLFLLPFAIVFFVVVFPLWGLGLGVLGLLLVIMRGIDRVSGGAIAHATARVHRAFRWVLTFGGFVRLGEDEKKS